MLFCLQCCFTSAESVRNTRNGKPRTATLTFTPTWALTKLREGCLLRQMPTPDALECKATAGPRTPFRILVYDFANDRLVLETAYIDTHSSTFLQILPEVVTPLKGTLYLRASVRRRCQHPPKGLGTSKTVEASQRLSTHVYRRRIRPGWKKEREKRKKEKKKKREEKKRKKKEKKNEKEKQKKRKKKRVPSRFKRFWLWFLLLA